jgi:predicted RNA-binding protein with PIN domain
MYIDGYNVLRKIPQLSRLMKSDADAARRRFIDFLATRDDVRKTASTTVVFDAYGEAITTVPWIHVIFTNTRSADSWIKMKIDGDKSTRNTLVISSDHEIQNHASAYGAAVMRAEEFLQPPHERREHHPEEDDESYKNRAMSRDEMQFWLDEFTSAKKRE